MRQYPLMIFAAGRGSRMGDLTRDRPKPLIPVAGRALLDHALGVSNSPAVGRKVVNLHYLADQIAAHLAPTDVALSWERDIVLETGGGLRHALPLLGPGPVLTLNSDIVWTGTNPLDALARAWDDTRMDALLMLVAPHDAVGNAGTGDFFCDAEGRLSRAAGQGGPVYAGAQLIRPERLMEIADRVFSLNVLWDRLIATGRVFGMFHVGSWCDVGRPEGIALAEALLAGSGHE